MRIVSIVGARPQFVKAAVLSAELSRRGILESLVHTGQHYDADMSDVFFDQLKIPKPTHYLGVGSGGHGAQTGEMMKRLEPIVEHEKPNWVLVYGDTNSTLAGALVGTKLHIPVAHVEAGLRSFNREMPEEINRVVADHLANLLLVPNQRAAEQLASEGIRSGVHIVGDLMVDLAALVLKSLPPRPPILDRFALEPKNYGLVTIHRASNTDDETTFMRIIEGLRRTNLKLVFPVHPRTRSLVQRMKVGVEDNILTCDPLSYNDMLALEKHAHTIFTDSGGIQKEALVAGVPCVTLRDETEWPETLEDGWNVLVGSDPALIARAAARPVPGRIPALYGDGGCAERIVDALRGPISAQEGTF